MFVKEILFNGEVAIIQLPELIPIPIKQLPDVIVSLC